MTFPDPRSTPRLLAESAWVHRLALRLVAEPAGAADAAQETLVRALEAPPRAAVPVRRWLAAVLRNVVRQERRATGRRETRERARAEERLAAPADELAARLELHGRLVEAVRRLEEPLRTAVALRFLEDLPVSEVARRTGVPEKTVYSRLERALEELRGRLDREHGGRAAWAALLVPGPTPAVLPAPSPLPLAPLLAMSSLWKWTGACAAMAVLGVLAVRGFSSRDLHLTSDSPPAPAPASALTEATSPLEPAPVPEREVRAASAKPSLPVPAPVEPEAEPVATLVGFVRDLDERPVAGVDVVLEPLQETPTHAAGSAPLAPPARTDGEGRFETQRSETPCRIVASGAGYATVLAPTLAGPPPPEPPVVYVSAARAYSGRIVDPEGVPVPDAELGIYPSMALIRSLRPGSLLGDFPIAQGTSDADGGFDFPTVGGTNDNHLSAWAPGFRTTKFPLPAESSAGLEVVLQRQDAAEHALAGTVRLPDGGPAAFAHVSTGRKTAKADAGGAFELELDPDEQPERIQAVLAGHLPTELSLRGLSEPARHELVLVLGDAALEIRGRVVDAEGSPVATASVWTKDGEYFGEVTKELGQVSFMLGYDTEDLIADTLPGESGGRRATADEAGGFRLRGLLARRYGLYVLDPRTRAVAGPFDVAAGADGIELTLPAEPARRVAGRVLSLSGSPIAKAHVNVRRVLPGPSGAPWTVSSESSLAQETDEDGRFAFEALCIEGTSLVVSSTQPTETVYELALEPDLEHLELAFPAPCHLRVRLDDEERADALALQDADGRPLELVFQIGGLLCTAQAVQIQGGTSDLITTDERARTLVLYSGPSESERIPIHLVPEGVNEIRP